MKPFVFAVLLREKLVSHRDLREILTYDECLDLLDIVDTDNYNNKVYRDNYKFANENK